jgi:gamma-glutamyltranspeptidase/glutathione hydrolase
LADKGHKIVTWPDWTWKAGGIGAITIDPDSGLLSAGADPRRMCYAIGW